MTQTPPQLVNCAVAVPLRMGRTLMLRRSSDSRTFPGKWCFPGGKKDDEDASLSQTALRELQEETGLIGGSPVFLLQAETALPSRNRIYAITAFTFQVAGTFRLSEEHNKYRWVTPSEGRALDVAGPTTMRILKAIS